MEMTRIASDPYIKRKMIIRMSNNFQSNQLPHQDMSEFLSTDQATTKAKEAEVKFLYLQGLSHSTVKPSSDAVLHMSRIECK